MRTNLATNPGAKRPSVQGMPCLAFGSDLLFVPERTPWNHRERSPALFKDGYSDLGQTTATGLTKGREPSPDEIRFTDSLPKTRSGKIRRRLLRDIASGKASTGDTTTLEDYGVLAKLREEEE